ncbi:phosphocholine cytidylyltransferase family protein [Patescibacteria group bacterium]|nr:phosphocholine cytidylyltransferase family protein [Patescibacteria group bacterium]
MNAIILAAGMGTRLGAYTADRPKCTLLFKGKQLIEHQVDTLRRAGITDITIVRGYHSECIQIPGVRYVQNDDFMNTNMVETLFCAESEIKGDTLIAYADILYEPRVIAAIQASTVDIGVTVDTDYWTYWSARLDHPEQDTESLVVNDQGTIIELGDSSCPSEKARIRYVGLIKLSQKGAEALKRVYHENSIAHSNSNEPWKRSKCFRKAYMTCLLQAVIDSGFPVHPIEIQHGWIEFDTVEDYERAAKWDAEGNLDRFIHLT